MMVLLCNRWLELMEKVWSTKDRETGPRSVVEDENASV